jgi:TPR repeat protein
MLRLALVILVILAGSGLSAAQEDPLVSLPLSKKISLAKAGDEEAMMAVAEAYELGRDTAPDLALAARWYRDVALKGNLEAQYRLAKIVRAGAKGLRKDLTSAITLLTDAASKKHPASQYELGLMHEQGQGVPKDEAKAADWYAKAAEQGHAGGLRNLGLMTLYGRGRKTDVKRAADLFQQAVAADDGWAMNNLAALYEQGWGVKPDLVKARELYAKAAALGVAVAETNIRRLSKTAPSP